MLVRLYKLGKKFSKYGQKVAKNSEAATSKMNFQFALANWYFNFFTVTTFANGSPAEKIIEAEAKVILHYG